LESSREGRGRRDMLGTCYGEFPGAGDGLDDDVGFLDAGGEQLGFGSC
jgi:hypothetical protein